MGKSSLSSGIDNCCGSSLKLTGAVHLGEVLIGLVCVKRGYELVDFGFGLGICLLLFSSGPVYCRLVQFLEEAGTGLGKEAFVGG